MKHLNYKLLEVDGIPVLKIRYYKVQNSLKGIVVLVHGVSHGAWCWINIVDLLTQNGYACFAINLRGHGDNNRKDIKGAHLSDYITDVIRSITYIENNCAKPEINIPYSKPFIIGHSMGGAIVESYISDFSHKVKGAVLFAPATAEGLGLGRIFTTSSSLRGLRTAPTTLFGIKISLACSNFFAVKNGIRCKSKISKEDLTYCAESLCRESLKAMLGLRHFELKNNLTIPVFVIGSDKDAYFPVKSLNQTAAYYGTKAMILKGLCHDMMFDKDGWKDSAEAVLEFLKEPDALKNKPVEFVASLESKFLS